MRLEPCFALLEAFKSERDKEKDKEKEKEKEKPKKGGILPSWMRNIIDKAGTRHRLIGSRGETLQTPKGHLRVCLAIELVTRACPLASPRPIAWSPGGWEGYIIFKLGRAVFTVNRGEACEFYLLARVPPVYVDPAAHVLTSTMPFQCWRSLPQL